MYQYTTSDLIQTKTTQSILIKLFHNCKLLESVTLTYPLSYYPRVPAEIINKDFKKFQKQWKEKYNF